MTTIIVTGIGGDVGQAVARILRRRDISVVPTDVNTLHAWTLGVFADGWFHAVPPANDISYTAAMTAIMAERRADLCIPTTDAEIARLSLTPWALTPGPAPLVQRFRDKWETAKAFDRLDLKFAKSSLVQSRDCSFRKSRQGRGGQGTEPYVWQRFLEGPEYTVAVWASKRTDQVRAFAMQRELRGGASVRVTYNPKSLATQEAEAAAVEAARGFGMQGSFNIQGKMTPEGFVPFEVNARFSSTASMRDSLGFSDVWWSVQEALGQDADKEKAPRERGRAIRYWAERVQVSGEWR